MVGLVSRERRVAALEGAQTGGTGVWHMLHWHFEQSWADVLASYPRPIAAGDNIMLIKAVAAENGKPVPDPIRERDEPVAQGWLAAHEARRVGGEDIRVTITKPR